MALRWPAAAAPPGVVANPARLLFAVLTSVWFAVANLTAVALAALLGVVFPQMPGFAKSDPALRDQWLGNHSYGRATPLLENLGLFNVFHTAWFYSLIAVLMLSVAVCTVSRFRPIWRSIHRPRIAPPPEFFATATARDTFAADDSAALAASLRARHYAVRTVSTPDATFLYADRFGWARLGTFATHLSLLMFVAGALLTVIGGSSTDILVAVGTTQPVFSPNDADHMQLRLLDFVHTTDSTGRDTQIQSDLAIYRHGELVKTGTATINGPLKYDGYTFHQAAFSERGAAITVTNPATGAVLYADTLDLFGQLPAPHVRVTDAHGQPVFDEIVAPTFFPDSGHGATAIILPGGSTAYVAIAQQTAGATPHSMLVSSPAGSVAEVPLGGNADLDGLRYQFVGVAKADYLLTPDIPGANGADTLVEMVTDTAGVPQLTLASTDGSAVRLGESETSTFRAMDVRFDGARAFSGITVKSDPGANWIWVAIGLLLVGLALTFYVPRRRLWLRFVDGHAEVASAGQGAAAALDTVRAIVAQHASPSPEPTARA